MTVSFGIAGVVHGEKDQNFDNAMEIGVVGGVIISAAGTMGIISYKDLSKNAFHMTFSIIACCVSIAGIYFDALELR